MSFSSEVKMELSELNNFSKKNLLEAELIGYMLSNNTSIEDGSVEFVTENEFNIERIFKILFNLGIDYEPEIKGKIFIARFKLPYIRRPEKLDSDDEKRALVRGLFLGSGSVNNPNKKYHLEILLKDRDVAQYVQNVLKQVNIKAKVLNGNSTIYIKEGEEISKFLAFIEASKAVLRFEEIRVMKDMRNDVNRKVNCETANLSKIVSASVVQIDAINFLKRMKKFEELPDGLREIAEVRVENPEVSLKELGSLLESPIGKSGVNHRLKRIVEIAEDIKAGK